MTCADPLMMMTMLMVMMTLLVVPSLSLTLTKAAHRTSSKGVVASVVNDSLTPATETSSTGRPGRGGVIGDVKVFGPVSPVTSRGSTLRVSSQIQKGPVDTDLEVVTDSGVFKASSMGAQISVAGDQVTVDHPAGMEDTPSQISVAGGNVQVIGPHGSPISPSQISVAGGYVHLINLGGPSSPSSNFDISPSEISVAGGNVDVTNAPGSAMNPSQISVAGGNVEVTNAGAGLVDLPSQSIQVQSSPAQITTGDVQQVNSNSNNGTSSTVDITIKPTPTKFVQVNPGVIINPCSVSVKSARKACGLACEPTSIQVHCQTVNSHTTINYQCECDETLVGPNLVHHTVFSNGRITSHSTSSLPADNGDFLEKQEEMRQEMQEKTEEAREAAQQAREEAQEQAQAMREQAQEAREAAQERAREMREQAQEAAEEARDRAQDKIQQQQEAQFLDF